MGLPPRQDRHRTNAMKSILLHSTLLGLFASSMAAANPVPFNPGPAHIEMYLEKVLIIIVGDQAKVSGTYNFKQDGPKYTNHYIYHPVLLPVCGAKGAPVKEMTPKYRQDYDETLEDDEQWWEEMDVVQPEQFAKTITGPGEMPRLDGQIVHWFVTPGHAMKHAPGHVITLEMNYTQKLSKGKFIYTPLLPGMKEGHDYGEITIVADRPLKLLDADKHEFAEKGDRLVVKPSHKRAVVIEVSKKGKAAKLP